jgi:hypothetical protein
MASLCFDRSRLGRLALTIIVLFVAILAVMLGPPWFDAIVSPLVPRRSVIAFLVGLEAAYVAALAAAGLGAVVFGWGFHQSRRRRAIRPRLARGLLLCASCLTAFALAEGTAIAWRAWTHRTPALTAPDPALPGGYAGAADEDELTLTVLGESSAEGMPFESWLSLGRIVAWQLGRAIPSRRFRLDLLARRGDTLADQYRKLAEVRRRPDLLIVYCGHNEFAAAIPWLRRVHHYTDDRPAPQSTFEECAARLSPLCGLIHETADRHRVASRPPRYSAPQLVDAPAYTPAEFDSRLADFRCRLEAIAAFGERIQAPTILVIPPGNDAGFEPNRSFLPAGTSRALRTAFARDFLAVRRSEDSDLAGAVARYRELLDRQPGFAETHYRLGILLARRGDWDTAYRHFVSARDLDGLPMRCPSAFQQVYRDVAAGHRAGTILIDGQALFHAIGPHGLLDDELFDDAMHPALRGHIALAQAILEALHARRAFGWPEGTPAPKVDPAECAAYFHVPAESQALCERRAMFYFATAPLRYDWSQRIARRNASLAAAHRIAVGSPAPSGGLPNLGTDGAPLPDSRVLSTSQHPS